MSIGLAYDFQQSGEGQLANLIGIDLCSRFPWPSERSPCVRRP